MKRVLVSLAAVVTAAVLLFHALPGKSFVPELETTGNRDKWNAPPTFVVNPTIGTNVSGSTSVTTVISNGFNVWTSAPNTNLQAINGGTTTRTAIGNDGTNVICFTSACTFPGGFGTKGDTLAITLTTTNSAGQILDADIVFNPAINFITDLTPAGSNQQSLPTVATHEIGHFFGLDHSAIVRAIMYPQAPPLQTTLSYDDVIGISTNYPSGTPTVQAAPITGTIRNGAGLAVFGAHVFAESTSNATPFGGSVRKSPIDTLSRPDGTYQLIVPANDNYNITAEPLDGPADNTNFGWAAAFGQSAVTTNFTTRQH
jgi:hypothetical protein